MVGPDEDTWEGWHDLRNTEAMKNYLSQNSALARALRVRAGDAKSTGAVDEA